MAPTTLPADVPPVPTAALAARLARTSVSGTSAAPVEATATATDAPSAIDAPAAVTTATDDPWARPPLRAAVVSERVGAAAPSDAAPTAVTPLDDLPPPQPASRSSTSPRPWQPVALAVEPVVADEPGAGPLTAAAAAAIIASPDVPAAPPEVKAAGPAEDQSPAPPPTVGLAEATALPAEPTTASLGTPTAGVAAIARPAAAQTIGTTVDNGESELWGLVGDPAQPSTSTVAAPATKSSSRATALLTIFVAIVVVALVLGFIYLFTSLL